MPWPACPLRSCCKKVHPPRGMHFFVVVLLFETSVLTQGSCADEKAIYSVFNRSFCCAYCGAPAQQSPQRQPEAARQECTKLSHASEVMLKILQARLQQHVNHELSDVQAGFRKGRGTRDQIANIRWIMEKARQFQKNIYFCFIDYAKALTVWITINCGKF